MRVSRVGQQTGWDCGLACVRATLRAFGKVPCGVINSLKPNPITGTSPTRIVSCLSAHGLAVRTWEDMEWDELAAATRRGVVIVPMQLHGDGHWVIVEEATPRGVRLMDPAHEPVVKMPKWAFMASWIDDHPPGVWLDRYAIEASHGQPTVLQVAGRDSGVARPQKRRLRRPAGPA